jgi:hypothetical protein
MGSPPLFEFELFGFYTRFWNQSPPPEARTPVGRGQSGYRYTDFRKAVDSLKECLIADFSMI